jgi:hypothetical protein
MTPIFLIIGLALLVSDQRVTAQTASNLQGRDNQQWLSHQMFQPQPRDTEKLNNSDKVIEEIKRLYMEAEKDVQAKNLTETKSQKP